MNLGLGVALLMHFTPRERCDSPQELRFPQFQFAASFIFFQKSSQILRGIQQPYPLLVIKRDRKASQSINTHATLFTYTKFQRSSTPPGAFLFQLRYFCFQFFVRWLSHFSSTKLECRRLYRTRPLLSAGERC